jgi:hypothetical protein
MIMKHKNHDRIVNEFEQAKQKQLEKLATKLLKQDEKARKLKEKKIESGFFKLFENGS